MAELIGSSPKHVKLLCHMLGNETFYRDYFWATENHGDTADLRDMEKLGLVQEYHSNHQRIDGEAAIWFKTTDEGKALAKARFEEIAAAKLLTDREKAFARLGEDIFDEACERTAECAMEEYDESIMELACEYGLAKKVAFSSEKYPNHASMCEEGSDYWIWGKALEEGDDDDK